MYNTEHYHCLQTHLLNEQERLHRATTTQEIQYREMLVKQIEKELKGEEEFLLSKGIDVHAFDNLSDDDLLSELL